MRGLGLVVAICVASQAYLFGQAPDTLKLAELLRSARRQILLTHDQTVQIRRDLLAWTDTRLHQGLSIQKLNDELAASGLFPPASLRESGDILQPYAGYLEAITSGEIPSAPDLMQINLAVGMTCSFDQTAVIYRRDTMGRVGWINELDSNGSVAWGVAPIVAGPPDASGKRILAAGLMHRWCTSNIGGIELRIWAMDKNRMQPLLLRGLGARRDEDITATVEGNMVTFRYLGFAPDVDRIIRPAIHRYWIEEDRATRIAPFAETIEAFIGEWLDLEGDALKQTSTREALQVHAAAVAWKVDKVAEFSSSSRCAGTPRLWQVGLKEFNGADLRYFLINENGAANLQMVGFTTKPARECPAVGIPELAGKLQP